MFTSCEVELSKLGKSSMIKDHENLQQQERDVIKQYYISDILVIDKSTTN